MGENTLKKHLEKCQKFVQRKRIKLISDDNIITPRIWQKNDIKINDIPKEIIEKLKKTVNENYEKFNITIGKSLLYTEEIVKKDFENVYSKEQLSGKNSKNIFQEISIFENAKKLNLILNTNKNIIVELGCGAAELSKTFQIGCKNDSSHILIDRMKYASKNKFDGQIQEKINESNEKNNETNYLMRDVIDIKNMDMKNYINKEKENNNVVFISKHLCGNAFELSIEKIISYHNYLLENKLEKNNKDSVIIATCCHYLLNSNTYCNFDYIKDILNITKEEFDYMIRLTSWGTLKDMQSEHFKLGKQIKYILDKGRCEYLKQHGFKNAEIVEYIDSTYTKENTLVIAYN
ncbi:hypothetical protein BCR36DRAFT_583717 [Piromyces finnis]|uniref:tRNA:m(4)X modification enzyme TRM13 n=1 Tax=Piromyces finnis TaxID=1754191 RepID=A0A1Y1V859_9FUNG|nr:hypothetical protein BCR36DRAFT_583717 [Piromyces finnis]|eukprot:ORX49647.1 hypothetical protein BCR36DRAFT_583717 [Piromyces finnis]